MTVNIGTIQRAYVRLWRAFVDAAGAQGLRAESSEGSGATVRQENDDVVATATIVLPSWPYKAVSKRRTVDIAIKVAETFDRALKTVTKATTNVGYFLKEEDSDPPTSRPLLELHYDFETPPREAHPLFHAQIGGGNWDVDKLKRLGMTASIERDGETMYGNARIPTAFVGFGTVLVAVAADHLKPQNYRKMIDAARQTDNGYLHPECARLVESLLPHGSVPHAHHWYDDRYVAYHWAERHKVKGEIPVLGKTFEDVDVRKVKASILKTLGVTVHKVQFVEGKPPA